MPDRNYKNPPIQEAVCEFQFSPPAANGDWDLTLPGKLQLHKNLQEYSGAPRQQHMQAISAGNFKGSPEINVQNTLHRIHLPTKDGKALLSIGHNAVGVVVLAPYEGWKRFRPRIIAALATFIDVSKLTVVGRIGVRYINRITTPGADPSEASRYLTGMQTTLKALEADERTNISGTLTAINTRHEFVTPERIKIYVTHATIVPVNPKTTEYLLDIDTVWDHEKLDDIDKITTVVDKLHSVEGGVFEALITPEARKRFDAA